MSETLNRILSDRLIAVVRTDSAEGLSDVVDALVEGGITIIEITLTIPNALDAIRQLANPKALIGAGTVLNAETAQQAIDAGARFIVSPILVRDVLTTCRKQNITVMPGAFTPTEIVAAWDAGADLVKVFPADGLGPAYFKAVRGPLPHIRIMPTGGVDLTSAKAFLDAGACCLGIGGNLVDRAAVRNREFSQLTASAQAYRRIVPL
ncbi:MAG: bifunctional 4-hydroxy-2-oxoglutarate aldolase/2-dehydro-3-deoxy-phosphogluconate aldolase [Gemmataceae bacterium]